MSIHWGVIYKKRFYYLLLSIKKSEFIRYSPGRLLISLLISWSNKDNYLYNYVKLNTLNGFYLFPLIKLKLFLKSLDKKNYLRKLLLTIKNFF